MAQAMEQEGVGQQGRHMTKLALVYTDYILARDDCYSLESLGIADALSLEGYLLCGLTVLFLVLSIVVSVTLPIFVFINRKKDGGMPPKKQPQAEQPVAQLLEESAAEAEEEVETAEGYAQPEEFEA